MAKGHQKENTVTRGKLKSAVEGFFGGDWPKKTPFFKKYGPHDVPGGDAPACYRPSGSGEGQIVGKFVKKGKS